MSSSSGFRISGSSLFKEDGKTGRGDYKSATPPQVVYGLHGQKDLKGKIFMSHFDGVATDICFSKSNNAKE